MTLSRRYTGRRQRYPANPIYSRLRFASHSGFTGLEEGYSVERGTKFEELALAGYCFSFLML